MRYLIHQIGRAAVAYGDFQRLHRIKISIRYGPEIEIGRQHVYGRSGVGAAAGVLSDPLLLQPINAMEKRAKRTNVNSIILFLVIILYAPYSTGFMGVGSN